MKIETEQEGRKEMVISKGPPASQTYILECDTDFLIILAVSRVSFHPVLLARQGTR